MIRLFIISISLISIILSGCSSLTGKTNGKVLLQDGDIIFHISKSSQSKAIQLATKSRYSHVGMVLKKKNGLYVVEAIKKVSLTPLDRWIKRGVKGHFVVKRLKDSEKLLTKQKVKSMHKAASKYVGKPYDYFFGWSDSHIYCSELVWKIYKEVLNIDVGKLELFRDFDFSHPAVKKKLKERYKGKLPLQEKVISPASMFKSSRLKTVMSG